eukprot:TRINITY_DN3723_c0_g1_i1.p1 TRINITY_DN3723_c0_g1~~TRINITY_DN3723_c0_g1_i1.p1  ORF type:complete len:337 (+),score=64.53 TRINITY_DN3723_c0_g1_i1:390-1400(+)
MTANKEFHDPMSYGVMDEALRKFAHSDVAASTNTGKNDQSKTDGADIEKSPEEIPLTMMTVHEILDKVLPRDPPPDLLHPFECTGDDITPNSLKELESKRKRGILSDEKDTVSDPEKDIAELAAKGIDLGYALTSKLSNLLTMVEEIGEAVRVKKEREVLIDQSNLAFQDLLCSLLVKKRTNEQGRKINRKTEESKADQRALHDHDRLLEVRDKILSARNSICELDKRILNEDAVIMGLQERLANPHQQKPRQPPQDQQHAMLAMCNPSAISKYGRADFSTLLKHSRSEKERNDTGNKTKTTRFNTESPDVREPSPTASGTLPPLNSPPFATCSDS